MAASLITAQQVTVFMEVLQRGSHDAWITLNPAREAEQRTLVEKALAAALIAGSFGAAEAVFNSAIVVAKSQIIEVNGDEWCECAEEIVRLLEKLKAAVLTQPGEAQDDVG